MCCACPSCGPGRLPCCTIWRSFSIQEGRVGIRHIGGQSECEGICDSSIASTTQSVYLISMDSIHPNQRHSTIIWPLWCIVAYAGGQFVKDSHLVEPIVVLMPLCRPSVRILRCFEPEVPKLGQTQSDAESAQALRYIAGRALSAPCPATRLQNRTRFYLPSICPSNGALAEKLSPLDTPCIAGESIHICVVGCAYWRKYHRRLLSLFVRLAFVSETTSA